MIDAEFSPQSFARIYDALGPVGIVSYPFGDTRVVLGASEDQFPARRRVLCVQMPLGGVVARSYVTQIDEVGLPRPVVSGGSAILPQGLYPGAALVLAEMVAKPRQLDPSLAGEAFTQVLAHLERAMMGESQHG